MSSLAIECRQLSEKWERPLADFFQALLEAKDDRYFHPHPLTPEEARKRAEYRGNDLYYVLVKGDQVLGYGMLRGWDEGYDIPSLGIALHPSARSMGLGKAFMYFLHAVARQRGAKRIRLKVHRNNLKAIKLYEELNYIFQSEEKEQLVGYINL